MADASLFTAYDYIIVSVVLIIPAAIGIYFGVVNKKTTEDLLVGGRNLRIFPVAASIMTTWTSAVTILGYPAEVYSYGIQIFQLSIMTMIFVPMGVYLFIPFFYDMKLTSINEYLEMRFNSTIVRQFASLTFILPQIVIAGIVLYAPSIALEKFLHLSPWISIAGLGIMGTIYTSVGGLKAVVWTDTFQLVLMYAGIISVLVRAIIVGGGISKVIEVASDGGRLKLFDFTVDPFMRHNFLNFLIGLGVLNFFQPGIGIHEAQRYSSLPSLTAAKRSFILSIPIKTVALGLCVFTGVAIYAIHAGCDPILLGEIKKADELLPFFLVKELAFIPGMLGIFTSAMFCGVLSTHSSAINGLVAVTWKDFLSKLSVCQNMKESSRSRLSIVVGILYGIIVVIFAYTAKYMGGVLQAANTFQGFPIGVLGAVYTMALFVPFANTKGVIGGMIVGIGSTCFISLTAIAKNIVHPTLELTTNNCPNNETQFIVKGITNVNSNEMEWPEKIYTLSYALYPALATITTFVTGIILSLLFQAFSKTPIEVNSKYLHPFIQKKFQNKQIQLNVNCSERENHAKAIDI